jgi:uncharacterized protein DUF3108
MIRVRAALAFLLFAGTVGAQDSTVVGRPGPLAFRLPVPFGVGERAEYSVKYGPFSVGSGTMEVVPMDTVRGIETWHTIFRIRGGVPGFRVNDRMESWMDVRTLASLRHRQELSEGSRERERAFEIYPDSVFVEEGKEPVPTVTLPLDDGSFLYFVRTITLEVGKEYSFDRYFRPDRNPVRIQVLRRERVKVPAGEFDAVVVRPIIQARGIFSENGRAEVWLTDDDRRLMVQMKSHLKFGTLSLYLKSYRAPTAPDSASIAGK